jgi:hypothetical protein
MTRVLRSCETDTKAEQSYSFLKDIPADDLRMRFSTIKVFNTQLARCMDMIDMTSTHQRWTIGYNIRQLGHLIFARYHTALMT